MQLYNSEHTTRFTLTLSFSMFWCSRFKLLANSCFFILTAHRTLGSCFSDWKCELAMAAIIFTKADFFGCFQTNRREKKARVRSLVFASDKWVASKYILKLFLCVCVEALFSMPNEFISCWLRCYVTTANSECPICYRRRNIHALTSSFTHPRP